MKFRLQIAALCAAGFALLSFPVSVATAATVAGSGIEIASDFHELNGNIYDYVRMTGTSVGVTADPGQIVRVVFLDGDGDIVAAEFTGTGTLTVAMPNATTNVAAAKYNFSDGSSWNRAGAPVKFVQGTAGLTVTGSNATTYLTVFAVGRATSFDQGIFPDGQTYDGFADLSRVSIVADPANPNGSQFGGLFCTGVIFADSSGATGVASTNVSFNAPVRIGDIKASGTAIPLLKFGNAPDVRIVGGNLQQPNGHTISATGIGSLQFVAGMDANGNDLPAQSNLGQLDYGVLPQVGQAESRTVAVGDSASFQITPNGPGPFTYQWLRDGVNLPGATGDVLTLNNVQPADAGIYQIAVTNSYGSRLSQPAILGVTTANKVAGDGTEVAVNVVHPAGWVFDQILPNGPAVAFTADPGQTTRASFIDENDDIVQVELTGTGTLSLVLSSPSGPAAPANYNQPSVGFMKGRAGIVIAGADETTKLFVNTVGRATAFDPTGEYDILLPPSQTNDPAKNGSPLFAGHGETVYDGIADLAFVAIASPTAKFGQLDLANVRFSSSAGLTGIFAPGVEFSGQIRLGDLSASGNATPVMIFGAASDVSVVGGDMKQANDAPVWGDISLNVNALHFVAGVDSHGRELPAQLNAGQFTYLVPDGVAADSRLVGSWVLGDPASGDGGVITFLPNGYYYLGLVGDAAGMERGVYYWNPATDAFVADAASPGLRDTSSVGGLSVIKPEDGAALTLEPGGNLAVLNLPAKSQSLTITRVLGSSEQLTGTWLRGAPGAGDSSIITFFPDHHYFDVEDGVPDPDGQPGVEYGSYTYTGATFPPNVLSANNGGSPLVDTNGSRGFGGGSWMLSINGDTITASDHGQLTTLTRIGSAPVQSSVAVAGFSPGSGETGTVVTISGSGFTNATAVRFSHQNAAFTVLSSTQITATVPAGVPSGKIEVVTAEGSAVSDATFLIGAPQAPTIVTPLPATATAYMGGFKSIPFRFSANPWATITVTKDGAPFTGSHGFSQSGGSILDATFELGEVKADYAGVYRITLTNLYGSVTLDPITLSVSDAVPTVTGFSPAFGPVGTTVTITGTDFGNVTNVWFDGNNASFSIDSPTQITATVPAGARSGYVSVVTPTGTISSQVKFVVGVPAPPVIVTQPPLARVLPLGGEGSIEFEFTANPFPSIAATKDGEPTPVGTGGSSPADPTGTRSGRITFVNIGSQQAGVYVITLTNDYGTVTLDPVTVTTTTVPTITGLSSNLLYAGAQVVITGTHLNGTSAVRFHGLDAASFQVDSETQITATVPPNVTDGAITVTNPAGTATSANYLVMFRPKIIAPPHNLAVTSGEPATFDVGVSADGPLTYQWRRFGFPISGATESSYTIPTALLGDTDYYDVVVTNPAGSVTSPMARLDVAPTSYPGQLGIDPGWSAPVTKDGARVNHVLPLPNGGFMAAGDFAVVDDHTTGAVARFKKDGSIDTVFRSFLLGQANRLALQPDGRILVLGSIRAMTGEGLRSGFVRLESNGVIDLDFRPPPVGYFSTIAVTSGGQIYVGAKRATSGTELVRLNLDGSRDGSFNAPYPSNVGFQAIAVQSDGNILLSYYVNGPSGTEYRLARLLAATGAEDPLFTPPAVYNVGAILPLASGKILFTGRGSSVGPTSSYCTQLNADGTVDSTFAHVPISGTVASLVAESSGTVLLGGYFDQVDGVARPNLARLNADGSLAPALSGAPATESLYSVAVLTDGRIVAAESPLSNIPSSLFRLDSNGTFDGDFAPPLRSAGQIVDIVRQAGGQLVIAGNFSHVGDVPQSNLARLEADGSVDTTFAPDGGASKEVQVLRRLADDSLFLGGRFGSVGGVTRSTWARLDRNGIPDESFSGTGGVTANGNDKHTLLPLPDGSIIVASDFFTEIVNQHLTGIGGVIRLTPSGDYDPAFSSAYGFAAQGPFASALQSDGKPILGGYSVGSSGTSIIRLLPDGHVDQDYHFQDDVYGLAIAPDGTLWAATSYGMSRLQTNGSPVAGFTTLPGIDFFPSPPPRLLPQNDGKMVVAALVLSYSSAPPVDPGPHLLRFASNGALDPTFGLTGLTADITAVVQRDDGQFYLASDGALRRTKNLAAPSIDTPPEGATALIGAPLALTVAASGDYLSYQWRKDGVALPGETRPSLDTEALAAADSGDYDVVVSNAAGVRTSTVARIQAVPAIIGTPPADAAILAGQSATFTVVANSHLTPLKYQWRRNGLNIPGATDATLALDNVPLNAGGVITVLVTNSAGSVLSDPAMLVVNPRAPAITSPLSVTGIVGRGFVYQTTTNTVATFSATGLPAGLSIDPKTGVIGGTPSATGSANVTLTAHNVTGDDTKTLVVTISPPPPVITSPIAAAGRAGTPFFYTIAASNTPTSYTMTGLPPELGLALTGNSVNGTPALAGTFTAVLTAKNGSGSVSQAVQFTFLPPLNAPAYSGSRQPGGTQNVEFSFVPAFAHDVASYAIVVGALPPGLTLDSTTGAIGGTPTAVGTFAFTLRATGSGGATDVPLRIVINPPATAPRITSASTLTATVNTVLDPPFALTTDVPATRFEASGLPDGLSLDAETGVISGVPTAPAIARVLVSAASEAGNGPTATLLVTVNHSPDAPIITSAPIASGGRVNVATDSSAPLYQIVASATPNHYEITFGALPNGLQLDANTGKITGTPTVVGTSRVAFAASNDAGGRGPSLEVLFTIKPPANVPVVISNGSAAGQVGLPFNYTIAGTNSPTSFGAVDLPAWLTQSNANAGPLLSGIPVVATTNPIRIAVTATNADGTSAPKTVAITIAPAPATPVITSALTASGRVGAAFTYRITASEGANSYSATDLPPGLTADAATGEISGTPTQAGRFTARLGAANASGSGRISNLVVTIAPAPEAPAIISAASAAGKVGVAFSYTIVARPGTIAGYALATDTDELPAGLSLNTTTGVISGQPAEPGLFFVNVTATGDGGTSLPQRLVIAIKPADAVPVITSPLFARATVGADFTYTISATNMPGGTPFPPAVMLDAVDLPEGLAANPSTGEIQGRPVNAGTFTATLVGTNVAGTGPSRDLTIFVQPSAEAPTIQGVLVAAGQVGVGFAYQIAATNNPIAYEVVDGPGWLTVSGESGALGGTPTEPGTLTARLVASNDAGESNPATLTLRIAPADNTPVITSSRAVKAAVGTHFSYVLTASLDPTSFVATGLPAGLSLTVDTIDGKTVGLIDGAPVESGTFPVLVSARNANGAGTPATLTLTVNPSLQIVTP